LPSPEIKIWQHEAGRPPQALGTKNESDANARWEQALALFRQQATQLNRHIVAWNLKVPASGFQRKRIEAEREIARISGDE